MTAKKILIIALALLVLSGGSLAFYNFYLKDQGSPKPIDQPTPNSNELNLKPIAISQESVVSPTIAEDGASVKYYLKNNGHVLKSGFDGSGIQTISSTNLSSLTKSLWSPGRNKVISFFSEGIVVKKVFFDYATKKAVTLNENIKEIAWSPDGQKIAYQFKNADGLSGSISLANPDGTAWKNIFPTRLEDLLIDWSLPSKISLQNKPSGIAQGSFFTVNPASGNLTKILNSLYGLSAKWSPDGANILYQSTSEKGKDLKLSVAAFDGTNSQPLSVATLTDKCVWSSDSVTIYCAVPQRISSDAVWPDDYLLSRAAVEDDFYLIDSTTGQKIKIAQSGQDALFDARELFLSPKEDYLFFVNQYDGLLYNLKLEIK